MSIMEADLHNLKINDPFLGQYQRLVRDVVIPYQWDALNDRVAEAEPSHAITNFRIAAGLEEGEFYGMVFQDSDVAKWLEAVAWSLCQKPDAELEKTADEVIELIAAAQCEDGYLNTYFTVKAPDERWTNLAECHELYCAGHMIEAGVAYFQAPENADCWRWCVNWQIISTPFSAPGKASFTAIRATRKSSWR